MNSMRKKSYFQNLLHKLSYFEVQATKTDFRLIEKNLKSDNKILESYKPE